MSVLTVARKDFQDAIRSRSLWFLSVLFLGFALITTYAYVEFPDLLAVDETGLGLVLFLASIAGLFVSLTAIVVCYRALAGERELGSMKLLLALPHTRRDVVLGKVLGRTAVMALPIVGAFAIAGVYGLATLTEFSVADYAIFTGLTVVFALAYVSIMVGISATTGSTSRASALTVGFFLVFEMAWGWIAIGIAWATNGFAIPQVMPEWMFVVNQIPPSSAFTMALLALIPDAAGNGAASQIDAFYGTEWLGVVMLLFWIVAPLVVGYLQFERADL